jgi:CRP-like cAMP-binding protein
LQSRPDGGQSVIRFIGPGEMFGTVAALMDRPFPADAVAVVDSTEIYWTVTAMRRLMTEIPEIALRSTASAGTRLFELQSRVGELSGERVEQRIARALVRLVQQAGRQTPEGVEIDFPISRQELAEMTGSTLHTVSRTLSAWDDAHITHSSRRHIVVVKPRALLAMAEGEAH